MPSACVPPTRARPRAAAAAAALGNGGGASASDPRGELDQLRHALADADRTAADLQPRIADARSVDVTRIYGRAADGGDPQYVECVEGAVILQPQAQRITVAELEGRSPAFVAAVQAKGYAVLLVRPNGFASFKATRRVTEAVGAKLGHEPVETTLSLRFRRGT
jgi:hypothetical protein